MKSFLMKIFIAFAVFEETNSALCTAMGGGGCSDSGCGSQSGSCIKDNYYKMCLCFLGSEQESGPNIKREE